MESESRSLQPKPRLLQRLQSNLLMRHYSPRTISAYRSWVIRYVRHHGMRHPAEMGEAEVVAFLQYLREDRRVAAATQTQALADSVARRGERSGHAGV